MPDKMSVNVASTQCLGVAGSRSQYPHQNPIASLFEPTDLDDLEIFGTVAEAEADLAEARLSCDKPNSRGPQAIPPGESATNGHQNRHAPDSQSIKSAHQPFCGCGFSRALSEISKMIHRGLNGCSIEEPSHVTSKQRCVAIPNSDDDGVANNSVDKLTPLLTQTSNKQKATRKPNLVTKTKKIRVQTPEMVKDNMLTSKADRLNHDNQGSSTGILGVCSVPIDVGIGTSNALRSHGHSYAWPIQRSRPSTLTGQMPTHSMERFWTKPLPDMLSRQSLHVVGGFSLLNENDQILAFQDQFNYTRSQQQRRVDDIEPAGADKSRKSGRKPSLLSSTKNRFRASLASLPRFLSTQVMTSAFIVAPPSMASLRRSSQGPRLV